MASCNSCRREVGCSCNLIQGQCVSCYSKTFPITVQTNTVKYSDPNAQPNTSFDAILNDYSLSQEEKLRRINEILEQAKNKT
jgi:hypothetical protein